MRFPWIKSLTVLATLTALCGPIETASAQPFLSLEQRTFTLSQPGKPTLTDVPIVRTASSAVDFYNYGSASARTGLERNHQSLMFLHYDISQPTNPISLIIIHGIDESSTMETQPSATVNMDIVGVPTTTTVTLSDDGGEFTKPTATSAEGRWLFGRNTDGGILGAFPDDQDWEITTTISGTVGPMASINQWVYLDPLGTDYELDFSQPFTITYEAPSATSTSDLDAVAGVPLEVCGTIQSSNGMNSTYSFDWDGGAQITNGTTNSANETVCDTYTFAQPGTYSLVLAADDGTGQATSTITINVVSACGDGLVSAGEACDDGNGVDGDGCSSTCAEEPGYSCALDPDAIANGSFEAPLVVGGVLNNAVPDSWSASSIDMTRSGFGVGEAPDGQQMVDLNALLPGELSQDIATVPGQRYTISFKGAYNDTLGAPGATARISASDPLAAAPHTQRVVASTNGFNDVTAWEDFTFTFEATSDTTRLLFEGLQPTSATGFALDQVVLENSVCQPIDDDGDGILSIDEDVNGNGDLLDDDTDGDMIPNYLDPDDDGDMIPTLEEGLGDSDCDGVPDYLDDDSGQAGSFIVGAGTEADPRAWSDGTFASNCQAYLFGDTGYVYSGAVGDGFYQIQPQGVAAHVTVYCDMTTDGGGWTGIDATAARGLGISVSGTTLLCGFEGDNPSGVKPSTAGDTLLQCTYDIDTGFDFDEIALRDVVIAGRSLVGSHTADLVFVDALWGNGFVPGGQGDVWLGAASESKFSFSLGDALGTQSLLDGVTVNWPDAGAVSVTSGSTLRFEFAESGPQSEGWRWESGFFMVRGSDLDGDGVSNVDEKSAAVCTNPANVDTDGDGLDDLDEITVNGGNVAMPTNTDGDGLINALDPDDDNDGVPTRDEDLDADGDYNEHDTDNNMVPNYLDDNDDGDAVSTRDEDLDADGDYNEHDTDGDTIPDWLDPDDTDGPTGDLDGDGIPNMQEMMIGTLVNNADSDGDGLCDGTISVAGVCTGGEDAVGGQNTDGDMLIDALDPDDDNDMIVTRDEDLDADGDYVEHDTDGDMIPNYLDPNDNDGPLGDLDGDGLTNGVEMMLGTQVMNADSDGDGLCDGTIAVMGVCVAGEDAAGGQNTDGDMLIDALDADDDGDGVNTLMEDTNMDGDPTNDLGMNGPRYLDPCDPDADAIACPTGDPDDDDVPNSMDPEPGNPCVPNANHPNCSSGDADGDGIPNMQEMMLGTLADNADSDGDGLCDGTISVVGVCTGGEDAAGGQNTDGDMLIDALDTDDDDDMIATRDEDLDADGDYVEHDTDGDMIPNYLDPNDNDGPDGDLDGDGLTNGVEVGIGTREDNADSDGDGLCDGTIAVMGVCVAGEDAAGGQNTDGDMLIDALDHDDDDDGVLTVDEDIDMDGDPTNDNSDGILGDMTPDYLDTDDDGDGVLTADEDVNMDGDPRNDDTNMNGVNDYLDPCDPDDASQACLSGDTDGDEVPNDMDPDPLDPCNPNPDALACPTGDTDGDGIDNATERLIGTDPTLVDSDMDGLDDLFEVGADLDDPVDSDEDMIIDALDPDDDDDGVFTEFELGPDAPGMLLDTDGDTLPNYLDPDDDGDGTLTADEGADPNGDGNPDDAVDAGDDGLPDYLDPAVPGDALMITAPTDGMTVGVDFTVSGMASPGDVVEVFVGGEKVGEVTAGADGTWSMMVTGQMPGAVTVSATVGDASDEVMITIEEGVITDEVMIVSPAEGDTVMADFTVSGTATPGAEVVLFVGDMQVGSTTADENGDWSVELDDQMSGSLSVEARVGDASDSVTVIVDESAMPPEVSIVTPVSGGMVPAGDLEVTGTATPGAAIEVFVDGESVGMTTADDEGNWSVTVGDVEPGERTVFVDATVDDVTSRSDEVTFTATDESMEDEFADLVLTGGCQQAPGAPADAPLGVMWLVGVGLVVWRRRRQVA